MTCDIALLMLAFGKHRVWGPRPDGRGGTTTFYYYDEVTWLLAALAVIVVAWFLIRAYQRRRLFRRSKTRTDRKALDRVIKIKRELSSRYLQPAFSANIHAVGIGLLEQTRQYCIQIFITDPNEELWTGAGAQTLPASYRGIAIVIVQMAPAILLSGEAGSTVADGYADGIRNRRDVIIGGISGANANLAGQSGTIGYFCRRRRKWGRSPDVLMLSNSHVFADLQKGRVDEHDLIMQPSPGEPGSNRAVGMLVDYSALEFDDVNKKNHVDAAIAKLWNAHRHDAVIPFVGAVKGYVGNKEVELGEAVQKFGRTTGFTEGLVSSICLDIWIQYDRTGLAAYFADQILIEPNSRFTQFVSSGDSGSLLVSASQEAVGLIFAGTSNAAANEKARETSLTDAADKAEPKRIEGYGVANPIGDVLDRMNIELLLAGDRDLIPKTPKADSSKSGFA